MDWNENILPDDIARYTAVNARVDGNFLEIDPGGYIFCTLLREDIDYIPDFLRTVTIFETGDIYTHYEPMLYIRLTIVDFYDKPYMYTCILNQTEPIAGAMYRVIQDADTDDVDIKTIEWRILLDPAASSTVRVTTWELRTSVALNKAQQDWVDSQLPSVIQFSNTTATTVSAPSTVPVLTVNFQLSAASNLLLHLILDGTASEDCEVTISIQLNSIDLRFSPMHNREQAGQFLMGIPGSLLQTPDGNNTMIIYLTTSAGTLTFDRDHIWGTLDGKNILGGYSAELPHAEVSQQIFYVDTMAMWSIVGEFMQLDFTGDASNWYAIQQPVEYANMLEEFGLVQAVTVDSFIVALHERYRNDGTYEYDPDLVTLDLDMQPTNSTVQEQLDYYADTSNGGVIHSITINNEKVKNYDTLNVVVYLEE